MNVGKYRLKGELKNDNSGFAKWGFATNMENGQEVFIKQFLTPVFPRDNTGALSPMQLETKKKICRDFYSQKSNFYTRLGRCNTGNIVTVNDFFLFGSKYYIVTEKVDAIPFNPNEIYTFSYEQKKLILNIILYCFISLHEQGIVHADVKPDNILFKRANNGNYISKIIDFDSSYLVENPPALGSEVQGDLVYLAPETFLLMAEEDVRLDCKVDVFALGVLFHQYFSGIIPGFDTETYNYAFEAVLDGQELAISPTIPSDVAAVIKTMLEVDPVKRPSVQEIFDTLNSDVGLHTAPPPPPAPPQPSNGWFMAPDDF